MSSIKEIFDGKPVPTRARYVVNNIVCAELESVLPTTPRSEPLWCLRLYTAGQLSFVEIGTRERITSLLVVKPETPIPVLRGWEIVESADTTSG